MKNARLVSGLIRNLKDTFDDRLITILLYGSCANEDDIENAIDINSIVVIKDLSAHDLKLMNPCLKDFMKSKNPLPLFMDLEEWFSSDDVYPVEYSDIQARYKILYGEDVVAPLKLERKNLRLQCEHETKNLLIKLRQNYIAISNDKRALENLLFMCAKSYFALFRAALRITDENVSFDYNETIEAISRKVEIDKDIFYKLLELKSNKKAISKEEFEPTIQKLIDSTNNILRYIDNLEEK